MKFLFLFLCLLSSVAFAEIDESRNQQRNLVDFSQGLNTKNSDFIVATNEGVEYDNIIIDTVEGALKKRNSFLVAYTSSNTDEPTSIHRLYKTDLTKTTIKTSGNKVELCDDNTGTCSDALTLSVSDNKFDWVTFNDRAYGTDGVNPVVKTDGDNVTYMGTVYGEDSGAGAGPNGDYKYKVTFYTTSYEVGFEVESPLITSVDNDIDLSMIPIAVDTFLGEDVLGRKIYRTSDGGADFKLLSNGTIANNTATTLTDSDTDAARGAAYPAVDDTCTPPQTKLIHLYNSRIFMANNVDNPSRVYWSEINRPECFLSDQYFDIRKDDGDQITVLETWLSNLAISKENSWQYLYADGADPLADWSVSDPYSPKGCRAIYSATVTPLGIYYLAGDGIYNFNGQYALLLSNKITPSIEAIDQQSRLNVYGAFSNNKYYMTFVDTSTGATVNNRTLVYDVITKAYTRFTIGFSVFDVFTSGTDDEILYSGSVTDGSIYAFTESVFEILHRKHDDFTGTFTDMRYIPTRWGGDEKNTELEISRTDTIDDLTGIIDDLTNIIDRESTTGQYISQVFTTNAASYSKLFWNESIPSQGGDVEFYMRTGADSTAILSEPWEGPYNDSTGSDISGLDGNPVAQYRIDMEATDIKFSPSVFSSGGYTVRVTYNKALADSETSIPLSWKSGIDFLKAPGYNKELTFLEAEFEGTEDFDVTITNEFGDTDTFNINMDNYPSGYYKEAFTTGKFTGKRFQYKVEKDDDEEFLLKRLGIVYNVDIGSVETIQ